MLQLKELNLKNGPSEKNMFIDDNMQNFDTNKNSLGSARVNIKEEVGKKSKKKKKEKNEKVAPAPVLNEDGELIS